MILIELRMCDRMKKTGRCLMNSNKGEISWNKKENHCGCGGCAGADGGAYGMEKI